MMLSLVPLALRSPWSLTLLTLLSVYLGLNLLAWGVSDRLIFRPPSPPAYNDAPEILKLSSRDARTRDRRQISALYLLNPAATYTILYSHGNSSDLGTSRQILETIRQSGFAVFAYDYQGYGTSEGIPSEHNTYADINAAYDYLTQTLQIPGDRIILYGFSVGSGPSVELARYRPVAGVILEGAFISTLRVATRIPILWVDRFRNLDKIRAINVPWLILHGTHDRVIPYWHGEKLAHHAQPPKTFIPVAAADHNTLLPTLGDRYGQILRDFAASLRP